MLCEKGYSLNESDLTCEPSKVRNCIIGGEREGAYRCFECREGVPGENYEACVEDPTSHCDIASSWTPGSQKISECYQCSSGFVVNPADDQICKPQSESTANCLVFDSRVDRCLACDYTQGYYAFVDGRCLKSSNDEFFKIY